MKITIDYHLKGTGWADCTLSSGDSKCELSASYLSDALRNLVLAATAVASGFHRVSFGFDEEPGEYRWVLSSPGLNEVELEILSFEDLWSGKPDADGSSLFRVRCLPEEFARAVQAAAHRVLEQHGEAGYIKLWHEHPFPSAQLTELDRVLSYKGPDV